MSPLQHRSVLILREIGRNGTQLTEWPSLIRSNGLRNVRYSTVRTESRPTFYIKTVVKSTLAVSSLILFGYYFTDTRAAIHRYVAVPALRVIAPDAEDAHVLGLKVLKTLWDYGLHPRDRLGEREEDQKGAFLETQLWDKPIVNPIYISAGLDKHGEAVDALFALGPSIVEIGCVTPNPQFGNPRPRVFRLVADSALINRYGFNSEGADAVARRLRERVTRYATSHSMSEEEVVNSLPASLIPGKLLAVQIGKNKNVSEDDMEAVKQAYVQGVRALGLYADVIVVNVSSPNTPGLRKLQGGNVLSDLLIAVKEEANAVNKASKPRIVVKISPDESSTQQITDISRAVMQSNVDGVVVANTTLQRPVSLESPDHVVHESGGLSGPLLYEPMKNLVREYRRRLPRDKEVWASGGISTGEHALEALKEGAGVVGVYTAMTYGGVGTIGRIKEEIRDIIRTTISPKS